MSGGNPCSCEVKDHANWRVRDYKCNYSAFNGYHQTRSDYSSVSCLKCGHWWRTKAHYVDGLKTYDAKEEAV
jgi:hypothetical protein